MHSTCIILDFFAFFSKKSTKMRVFMYFYEFVEDFELNKIYLELSKNNKKAHFLMRFLY